MEFFSLWDLVQEFAIDELVKDNVTWRQTPSGSYTAKSAYELFFVGRTALAGARELWTAGAPLKHKLHMWLVLRDRLWTADRLARRGMQHNPLCPLCCQEAETIEHITVQCSYSREVWYHMLLPRRLHRFTPSAAAEIKLWWPAVSAGVPRKQRKELNGLIVLISRELWLERNARVFDKSATMPMELCKRIKGEFAQWGRARLWDAGGGVDSRVARITT